MKHYIVAVKNGAKIMYGETDSLISKKKLFLPAIKKGFLALKLQMMV
jgi:hypothetical protein